MARLDLSPPQHTINNLIAALFIGAIPHFIYQPFWVCFVFVLMMAWRLMHHFRDWPLPTSSRALRFIHSGIAILTVVFVIRHFDLTIGRDAGVALLTIMLALKVVEIRSLRDYYLSVFLGFFLVITNFFFTQNVLMVMLMLAVVILLTNCLVAVNSIEAVQPFKNRLKLSARMVVQAIPVMLFLFVLFPRIPGPIWGLPEDANTASTGLSEEMSPGSISDLVQSDKIAFRVSFDENKYPTQNSLYWRGPVLWQTDGTTWTPIKSHKLRWEKPDITSSDNAFSYTVTLEPQNENWLLALDMPTDLPKSPSAFLSPDGRLLTKKKQKQRLQYTLLSSIDYQFNAKSDPNIQSALQLPESAHPKTIALAESWAEQIDTPEAIIQKALSFYSDENFFYTLKPPKIEGDSIDGFLFDSRQGFCEHYAASFTILMRAAGIPARVVTGYLGGNINPVDDILIVRQRDAHAWVEVWLKDQGWVRVDPTAAVSSDRIESGISDLLPEDRRSPVFIARNDVLLKLWQQIQNNWDAFNSAWDMWVVGFGPEKQLELLSLLGMKNPNWQKMGIWLTITLSATGIMMLLLSFSRRQRPEPCVQLYLKFCSKLAAVGLHKQSYEGPQDFAVRAVQSLPQHQKQINRITDLYTILRYRQYDETTQTELQQQLEAFNPNR